MAVIAQLDLQAGPIGDLDAEAVTVAVAHFRASATIQGTQRIALRALIPGVRSAGKMATLAAVDDPAVEALAPGLEDLVRTCPVPASIVDESEQEGRPTLMLYTPDGSGAGIWVDLSLQFPEQVAHTADQLQDWAVEALWQAGLPAVWPPCDLHPDTHPLKATVVDGVPHWVCPVVDTWEIRIGALDPSV